MACRVHPVCAAVLVRVPDGAPANIYIMAIPTPPFELEDIYPFVEGYSLIWPYKYKVKRLSEAPDSEPGSGAITLADDAMLELTPRDGNGFTYDCFVNSAETDPAARLQGCLAYCGAWGFRNSTTDQSCNQQYSCRNACYIRADGAPVDECEAYCDRGGLDGCSVEVRGRSYDLCGACVGESETQLPEECVLGCQFEEENAP